MERFLIKKRIFNFFRSFLFFFGYKTIKAPQLLTSSCVIWLLILPSAKVCENIKSFIGFEGNNVTSQATSLGCRNLQFQLCFEAKKWIHLYYLLNKMKLWVDMNACQLVFLAVIERPLWNKWRKTPWLSFILMMSCREVLMDTTHFDKTLTFTT